jgi:hypothetical protein
MARIRTIKPEFFTSEDIVGLSPMARLLYIAVWCEADKEGRLVWKPMTFKLRYFPGDNCDIQAMCAEIIDAGLVKLYGEGFAVVPSFKAHQHINPRESDSQLPEPVAIPTRKARVATRQAQDSDAQGGREGKGREGVDDASPSAPTKNGSRLPEDWVIPSEWMQWAESERPDIDVPAVVCGFRDYWVAKPGKDGRKLDWQATWRNWVRNQRAGTGNRSVKQESFV